MATQLLPRPLARMLQRVWSQETEKILAVGNREGVQADVLLDGPAHNEYLPKRYTRCMVMLLKLIGRANHKYATVFIIVTSGR